MGSGIWLRGVVDAARARQAVAMAQGLDVGRLLWCSPDCERGFKTPGARSRHRVTCPVFLVYVDEFKRELGVTAG